MRRLIAAVALAQAVLAACSSGSRPPDPTALAGRVREEALRVHVEALASGPRNGLAQPEAAAAAARYMQARLEDAGLAVRRQDVAFGGVSLPNVTAEKRGDICPERIFILGAHYDTQPETPGADDNASGVAGVLEAAHALSGASLPASVWFVGFAFEEEGLVGSAAMAQAVAREDVALVGMVSLDMIGFTAEGQDATGGPADALLLVSDPTSEALARAFERAAASSTPDLTVRTLVLDPAVASDIRRSDHAPFWNLGYRALMLTDGANLRNPNYHLPGDTVETLDFVFLARATQAVVAGVASYLTADADGDGAPDVCGRERG